MTEDEFLKTRREQEFNIGDHVIAHGVWDMPLFDGKVATIIEKGISDNKVYYGLYIEGVTIEKRTTSIIGNTSLLAPFYASDLELVDKTNDSEEKEPKSFADVGMVSEGTANRLAEQLSKMNREITQNAGRLYEREGAIKSDYNPQISLELNYTAYRMELATKIAIAYAEKGRYEPSEIGAKAVAAANGVAEQLKNNKI